MAVGTTAATFLRQTLYHTPPAWVASGSLFFVTVCCEARGVDQLCRPGIARSLLDAARFYHDENRWFVRMFLLMPDHFHALLAFPPDQKISEVMRSWKRYTTRTFRVAWQRQFFDHRLRNDESWELKARYIRENPVRKGLVAKAGDWPWVLEG